MGGAAQSTSVRAGIGKDGCDSGAGTGCDEG